MAVFECTIDDITFRNDTNGWTVMRVRIDRDRVSAVPQPVPAVKPGRSGWGRR